MVLLEVMLVVRQSHDFVRDTRLKVHKPYEEVLLGLRVAQVWLDIPGA